MRSVRSLLPFQVACLCALVLAPGSASALVYNLVPYDPPGANSIVSGSITTDGTLGSGLNPTAIIIDFSASLTDGSVTTFIDFTDGVLNFGATKITATSTELTLDVATGGFWCLGPCGLPDSIVYQNFSFAPSEMNVLLYVNGTTTPSQGLVGSRVIATVPEPATLGLLGMGLAGLTVLRRRRT